MAEVGYKLCVYQRFDIQSTVASEIMPWGMSAFSPMVEWRPLSEKQERVFSTVFIQEPTSLHINKDNGRRIKNHYFPCQNIGFIYAPRHA